MFFSINFIIACFWEVLNSPAMKDYWIEAQSASLTTSQNFMQKSFVMPSFPGDLSLFIDVKAFKSSHSVKAPSQLRVWFSFSLGRDTLIRKLCVHFSDTYSFSLKRV